MAVWNRYTHARQFADASEFHFKRPQSILRAKHTLTRAMANHGPAPNRSATHVDTPHGHLLWRVLFTLGDRMIKLVLQLGWSSAHECGDTGHRCESFTPGTMLPTKRVPRHDVYEYHAVLLS